MLTTIILFFIQQTLMIQMADQGNELNDSWIDKKLGSVLFQYKYHIENDRQKVFKG